MPVYGDDFNRADSANLGTPWVNFEGYICISNNKATQPDTNLHTSYYNQPFAADQWSEADVVWDPGGSMTCLCVRFDGANGDLYYTWRNGLNISIFKRQGWSWSQVGSNGPAVTLGVPMKIRLEAQGTTIRLYQDGVLKVTATDPGGIATGQAGLLLSNGMGATLDNFRSGDLPYVALATTTKRNLEDGATQRRLESGSFRWTEAGPPKVGTATVSWVEALAAVGKKAPKATVVVNNTFNPVAVGKKTPKASAVINDTFNPVTAGKKTPKGTADTANFLEAVTVQGKRSPKGTITVSDTWVPAAIGAKPIVNMNQGAATVSYTFNPVSLGKRTPKAAATLNNTFDPVAVGKKFQNGTAITGNYVETLTSVGKRTPKAVAVSTVLQTLTAAGYRQPKGAASTSFFIYNLVAQGVMPIVNMNQGSGIALWRASTKGGSPGGGAPVTPTNPVTAGLSVRLDASTLGLPDGARVSSWPNLGDSGSNPTLVATPLPKVLAGVLNGLPVVRFTAAEGRLRGFRTATTDVTLVYLVRMTGPSIGRAFTVVYPPINCLVGWHISGGDCCYDDGWIRNPSYAGGFPTPWRMYGFDRTIDPILHEQFFVDGVMSGEQFNQGQGLGGTYNLSGYDPAGDQESCDFEFAELVLYDRKLADVDRVKVEDYFKAKWLGIGVVIDNGTEGWAIGKRDPVGGNSIVWASAVTAAGKKFQNGVAPAITWTEVVAAAGKRVARSDTALSYAEATVAVGQRTPKAAAMTTHTWTPAAIGAKPIVNMNQGAALTTWSDTLAAAGKRTPKAVGVGNFAYAPVAVGKLTQRSTATVSWLEDVPVAPGKRTPKASATTTAFQLTAAAGKRFPKGAGVVNHTWVGVAQGVSPLPGVNQGSGLVSWRASTTGGSPTDVPPAVLPVTAGLLIRLDATLIGAADGASLGAWADTSGNGLPALATSGTSTYRSAGINGHPAVRFGESGLSEMQVNHGHTVSDRTIFQVVQTVGGSNGAYHTTQLQELSPYMQTYGTNGGTINTYTNPAPLSSGVGWSGAPQMITVWCSTATASQGLEVDGTQVTSSWSPEATPSKWFIGGFTPAAYGMSGFIGEMIIYERCLSAIERQQVQDYLNTKWAVGGGSSTGTGLEGWAIGKRDPKSTIVAPVTWAPTAVGKKAMYGAALDTTWTVTPVSVGKRTPKASAAVNYYEVLAVAGKKVPKGTSNVGNHSWTMTAQGIQTVLMQQKGTGIIFNAWATAAVGKRFPQSAVVVAHTWPVSVAGKKFQNSAVVTTYEWHTDVDGKKIQHGVAVAAHEWALDAGGQRLAQGSGDTDYWFSQVALGLKGIAGEVEVFWNGQTAVAMYFGDKQVVEWMMIP